jgi:glycosyltransferase involved in cell wall biosynthesis
MQLNENLEGPLRFHIIGNVHTDYKPRFAGIKNVILYGSYERGSLTSFFSRIKPTLTILPSIWPETFCHTLTESWAHGVPVVGSSYGAIGERIKQTEGGWTLEPIDAQIWYNTILKIINDKEDYLKKVGDIAKIKLKNTEEMKDEYYRVYCDLLRKKETTIKSRSIWMVKYFFQNMGFEQRGLGDLQKLSKDDSRPLTQNQAAWILAVWYSNKYDRESAKCCLKLLSIASQNEQDEMQLQKITLLKGECYSIIGKQKEAQKLIRNVLAENQAPDLYLAAANQESSIRQRIDLINKALSAYGVSELSPIEKEGVHPYDGLNAEIPEPRVSKNTIDKFKVTIIVPAFNSANTITTALDSILAQTWYNLEILVVDDCSTDDTAAKVAAYAEADRRVKLIKSDTNKGPYVARNMALESAAGAFVTCNDADDWSHPQKIEIQALHLINNPEYVANISKWARLTNDLVFYRRGNPGFYIQPNVSSLMFRRKRVMEKLGYWDSVRFGADTELITRIKKVFGENVIEEKDLGLLSFGRSSANSLTENKVFGYPGFFMGARNEYRESYLHHHELSEKLKYHFPQRHRPFPIPDVMRPTAALNTVSAFHPKTIIAADFRFPEGISSLAREIKALKKEKLQIGLVQMTAYDLEFKSQRIDKKIRELIDGDQIRMIVYGETIRCDTLVIRSPTILQEKQNYIPTIQAGKICVIIDPLPYEPSQPACMRYDIKRCKNHLNEYFGNNGLWYPANSSVRRRLDKHYHYEIGNIALSDQNWSQSIITGGNPADDLTEHDQKNAKKAVISEESAVKLIDVKNLNSFAHFNTSQIVVVMPCVDTAKGQASAEILAQRADIDCSILIMYDTLRQGFIKTLNDTAAHVNAKYIVYLAEDAFPGRGWLRSAYEALEQSGKGLLGFNDGKWKGRIASFGMVQTDWVQGLYQGPVFCPEYKSHKADNELTVIARASDMYVYNPDSVLVEHDPEKDLMRGSNPVDDDIFGNRFVRGFDGILQFEDIRHLAKEYKVKVDDYL